MKNWKTIYKTWKGKSMGSVDISLLFWRRLIFEMAPFSVGPLLFFFPVSAKQKKKPESKQFDFNQVKWNWIANYYQSQIGCVNRVRTEGV